MAIEHVLAWVCRQCGEQYDDAPIYKQMERIAQQGEQIHRRISFPLAEFEMALRIRVNNIASWTRPCGDQPTCASK